MENKKGFALAAAIFLVSLSIILGAILTKMVYNASNSAYRLLAKRQAFYRAEAGIEKGKYELAHNPNWYTDLPYSGANLKGWVTDAAVGQRNDSFKVVRERGKDYFYAVGRRGKGRSVVRVKFSDPPFKTVEWKEL